MKKILVTGSSGQLGSEIVNQLKERKYHVSGIDIVKAKTTDQVINICDPDTIIQISKGFDAMIHTAAIHGKHYELKYPREKFIDANIKGTLNLLNACVENKIKKFLYTSTTSIYGNSMSDKKQAVWVDESLIPDPRDIYDITKWSAELLCKDYFEKEGIETTVLRVSRFLPEDENTMVIHRLYRGLDVRDGAYGHILALEKSFNTFQTYNISNESPFNKKDLNALFANPKQVIKQYFPHVEAVFKSKTWFFPNTIDRVYSIEKAKKELGYYPKYNFDSLLENIKCN